MQHVQQRRVFERGGGGSSSGVPRRRELERSSAAEGARAAFRQPFRVEEDGDGGFGTGGRRVLGYMGTLTEAVTVTGPPVLRCQKSDFVLVAFQYGTYCILFIELC